MDRLSTKDRLVALGFVGIGALSIAILVVWIRPQIPDVSGYDDLKYVQLSFESANFFWDPLRTFGYPLFLAAHRKVFHDISDWIELVRWTQFVLHCLSALLAVAILRRLCTVERIRLGRVPELVTFAFVQCSLILLALTRHILTDSVCVFLFTLFVYGAISNKRLLWMVAGLSIGLAAVIRPFYFTFALTLLGIFAAWTLLSWMRTKEWSISGIPGLTGASWAALPFLLIVGPQFMLVLVNENRLSFVGSEASKFAGEHMRMSAFVYKYETYVGDEDYPPEVLYLATPPAILGGPAERNSSFLVQGATAVAVAVKALVIKTVGLFQNYELSVYRQLHDNNWTGAVFLYGILLLAQFTYFAVSVVGGAYHHISEFVFVYVAVCLHVFAYSALTLPEGRFIAPIIPVLSAAAAFTWVRDHNSKRIVYSAFFAITLYVVTYIVLTGSQLQN